MATLIEDIVEVETEIRAIREKARRAWLRLMRETEDGSHKSALGLMEICVGGLSRAETTARYARHDLGGVNLMSTKPDTETGWSKELPEAQGWYWVRSGPRGLPVAVEFFPTMMDRRRPMVRYPGKDGFMVAIAGDAKPEWLGPISPSDFEQLLRLRAAARSAMEWMSWWVESEGADPPDGPSTPEILAALREALTNTGEQS